MQSTTIWQHELAHDLTAAASRERKGVIARYVELTGKTSATLYRVAKKYGWESGRKKREDAGELRSGLNDQQVEYIAGLLYTTARENKGPIMPVERALQIAEDNAIIEPGQITPAGMNRILRDRELSKACLKAQNPHTEMRSLYPNHVHAFDASVCIQYYLDKGKKKLTVMDERKFYKNKLDNFREIKTRLMRYVVVDHFSGAFCVRYYDAGGESAINLHDFLVSAWSVKGDDRYPFRGAPELLLVDRGAANMSNAIADFLERLGVTIPEGLPYNPRRQGIVEGMHNIVEEWFESSLRIDPASDIETINSHAQDMFTWHQAKKIHTRHGLPRTQCWLKITKEQLRELPSREILQWLFEKPEETRTVDGSYSITFKGKDKPYNLRHIPGLYRGAKVQVALKPYIWPTIEVRYKGEAYLAEPKEMLDASEGAFPARAAIIGEEYKAPPESTTQKAKKRMQGAAYGEDNLNARGEPKKGKVPYAGATVFGIHAAKLDNLTMIPKEGTAIKVEREVPDAQVPIMQLFKRLNAEGIRVTPQLNEQLRERLGKTVAHSEIDSIINELRTGGSKDDGAADDRAAM